MTNQLQSASGGWGRENGRAGFCCGCCWVIGSTGTSERITGLIQVVLFLTEPVAGRRGRLDCRCVHKPTVNCSGGQLQTGLAVSAFLPLSCSLSFQSSEETGVAAFCPAELEFIMRTCRPELWRSCPVLKRPYGRAAWAGLSKITNITPKSQGRARCAASARTAWPLQLNCLLISNEINKNMPGLAWNVSVGGNRAGLSRARARRRLLNSPFSKHLFCLISRLYPLTPANAPPEPGGRRVNGVGLKQHQWWIGNKTRSY